MFWEGEALPSLVAQWSTRNIVQTRFMYVKVSIGHVMHQELALRTNS